MKLKFGVIGPHHGHIYAMIDGLLKTGRAECVSFFAGTPDSERQMLKCFPFAESAPAEEKVLGNPDLQLICSADVNDRRGALAIRAMQAGKDFLVDKPGVISLSQLEEIERVQRHTGRLWFVWYGERLMDPCSRRAVDIVRAGMLGRIVNVIGLGPHKLTLHRRPDWMFRPDSYGGILTDLGIHSLDMFVQLAGPAWSVLQSRTGNFGTSQYPRFEDFGDMTLSHSDGCTGYIRVDWLTPDAMPTYGDQRFIITGTHGMIELRKTLDLAVDNHRFTGQQLIFATQDQEPHRIDCSGKTTFYEELIQDVHDRVNRCVPHSLSFAATRLALDAQQRASHLST